MTDSKKPRTPESRPDERWVPVVYRGISFSNYMVSDMGRVKSLPHRAGNRTVPGKALRPFSNGQENADKVVIYESGVRRPVSVRTLVATAFLGPRPDGHVVIH